MQIVTTPELLTEEHERLPAGDPGAELLASEASTAIAEKRARARGGIFTDALVLGTRDHYALIDWHEKHTAAPTAADQWGRLHGRALAASPELAALLRSPEIIAMITDAAESIAQPLNYQEAISEARHRVATAAIRRYEHMVCEQLAAAGGPLAAPAREVLACELLAERLAASRALHAEAARLAAERLEAERRADEAAAEQAIDAAEVERLLGDELSSHGLPRDLRTGEYVAAQLQRLRLLVPLRRRLLAATVDGVRTSGGYYDPRRLAGGIADASVQELELYAAALSRAQGRTQPS
ncbi:MAG TPA: hypothetical protein VHW23_12585 [Kofleriaceae bacterium]|jgi:hypothetical protein|nr:hypothetical protein [Kofleriaceae bacterium]